MALDGNTAIDIPLLKIVDWLAERKFLQPQWRAKNKALQQKASELSQQLLGDLQDFKGLNTYLDSQRLRNKLLLGAEKSILGYYKGDAGVWDKLVRAYELENIHIGETALRLIRNGEYEIPFLQAQTSKHQQQLVDFEKKESEYGRMALNAQKSHTQECSVLGIDGNDIEAELLGLTEQLPQLMLEAAEQLKSRVLKESMQYYADFTNHVSQSGAQTNREDLLPNIAEIQRAELSLPQPEQSHTEAKEGERAESPNGAAVSGEADWDFEAGLDSVAEGGDIDWDIALEDGSEEAPASGETNVVKEEPNMAIENMVARLAEDQKFRAKVAVELSELTAFLAQRCLELSSAAHSSLPAATPASLQQISLSSVQEMQQQVSGCLKAFTSERVTMLTALRATSSQYFRRTCAALSQQGSQEAKYYRLQRELQSKRQELQTKLMEDAAKLSAITAETREFKAFVEEQISPLVKGCKIHITGDINNTLMRS